MNPEFLRNLVLELTPHRLIAMPLILVLIYAVAMLTRDPTDISETARFVMIAVLVLWGTRLAADAVLGEVAARTWDAQRMSSLGPWSMGWGKLLGSTAAAWYVAALSVPAFLYSGRFDGVDLVRVLMLGLFAQSLALFTSLVVLRQRLEKMRFQVTLSQLAGIGGAILFWVLLDRRGRDIAWYGTEFTRDYFLLLSGITFAAWSCFGIHRLLRAELQFRCWPVGWTGFVLFCAVYIAGFGHGGPYDIERAIIPGLDVVSRLFAAYLPIVALTWIAAYAEPKGFVRLRRWGSHLRSGDLSRILDSTPVWIPGLAIGMAVGLALIATWGLSPHVRELYQGFQDLDSLAAFVAALFLFLLRDIGVLHLLTLDGRARRGQLAALVYLAVLYVLIPLLLAGLGFYDALPVLLPYASGSVALIVLPVLLQVVVVGVLLAARWRQVSERMATH